jgi:hypothetical protein
MNEEELSLLGRLAPRLNERLGPLVIWTFSASFMPGLWISRVDYTLEGEDPKRQMKSVLIEGRDRIDDRVTIDQFIPMRPRIFRYRPSIAILREGLIMLELESPDLGERVV